MGHQFIWLVALLGLPPEAPADCGIEDVGWREGTGGELVGSASCCDEWHTMLTDGSQVEHELSLNATKLYFYENLNASTMNLPEGYRKLIFSLEPCEGVVYLFVRKTRRCWPDPFTCCRSRTDNASMGPPPCNPAAESMRCSWTHFHSTIDGSKDGAPTFFEVTLTSTKYYMAVYAPYEANLKKGVAKVRYRFMVLADIGAFPRPGLQGQLRTEHISERSVKLTWDEANFLPAGISSLMTYQVYSTLLLDSERKDSAAVLLNPSKVMNTVCGLQSNAVTYGHPLTSTSCTDRVCSTTISGIIPGRRYMLNVVSKSYRRHSFAYSGIIVSTDWQEQSQLLGSNLIELIVAICCTLFGVIVIGYLWIVKVYD